MKTLLKDHHKTLISIGEKNNNMKTVKFKNIEINSTFYMINDYARIDMYEKLSDNYAEQILTASSRWFDDEIDVYVD